MATTDIEITSPTIRLGQLLKLSGAVDSGGDVRALLEVGQVTVNGAVEVRRGRQLRDGDLIAVGAARLRVVSSGITRQPSS